MKASELVKKLIDLGLDRNISIGEHNENGKFETSYDIKDIDFPQYGRGGNDNIYINFIKTI